MYRINRKLWITAYATAFAVMATLAVVFGTGWAWGVWACLFGLFVVFTEPAPRLYERDPRRDRYNVPCDCPKCDVPGCDGTDADPYGDEL